MVAPGPRALILLCWNSSNTQADLTSELKSVILSDSNMKSKKFLIKLFILLLLAYPIFFPYIQIKAERKTDPHNTETQIKAKKLGSKANAVSAYLAKYNSPLQYHAQDFIDASETYALDWKMLPAIAGVESTFGKFIPGGYNAWGWGVYGTQAIYFNSWKDAIFTIAKGLRENYLDKGLTEPYAINRVYAASSRWGGNVSYFMKDIEEFSNNYQKNQAQTISMGTPPKIAALSGRLNLR